MEASHVITCLNTFVSIYLCRYMLQYTLMLVVTLVAEVAKFLDMVLASGAPPYPETPSVEQVKRRDSDVNKQLKSSI